MKEIYISKKGMFATQVWVAKEKSLDLSKEKVGVHTLPIEFPKGSDHYPWMGVKTPWGETFIFNEEEKYKSFPKGTNPENVLKTLSSAKLVPLTRGRGTMMVAKK